MEAFPEKGNNKLSRNIIFIPSSGKITPTVKPFLRVGP
jgi:hypothetical protein